MSHAAKLRFTPISPFVKSGSLSGGSMSDTSPTSPTFDHRTTRRFAVRLQLLQTLPPGGIVAEVRVFKGRFSRRILDLDIVGPQRLHLIDPWVHQELPLWKERNDENHLDFLIEVQGSLQLKIASRRVIVHQGFSLDVLELFPDHCFDWVYLDGDHRYEKVRAEQTLCDRKVKLNGLILGHDYIKPELYPPSHHARLGVVFTVRDFCTLGTWKFVLQTPRGSKQCPTFVLRRRSLEF
ncbi:MAG: class I SAM-dependent methyltransferase [Myxococcales bacterium]